MKRQQAWILAALAAALALGLTACGGGSSAGSSSQNGTANVAITDGPSDEFQHVWVTITEIAFHTDPNAVWSASDATWIKFALPSPVTVDLTALNNGALNNLFTNLSLPSGTYRQIRFLLDPANANLDTSAYDTKDSNGNPLQYNEQVEYLNPNNSWAVTEAPLEIAYPTQGIQLTGTFNLTAGSTLDLAVDFDLEHSIVAFVHGSDTYFTMRPNLAYFDMANVGAITGTINPALLCGTAQEIAALEGSTTQNCAFNLVVKAELLSSDGSRHYVARQTTIDPTTGSFTLYPLATQDASGNAITSYDVLIRGRDMETILVTGVPVSAGTAPGGTGAAAPTVVQSTDITPTINTGEYTAQFASALSPLTSGYAVFQQTLPLSGAVPYEVRFRNTDPFTGEFRNPIPLQGASSSLHVAAYDGGDTLSFTSYTPQEGAGAFTVADNEVAYYTLSSGTVMPAPSSGTTQTFTPGVPTLDSGVQLGSASFNLTFTGISSDNSCELVIVRFATIVDSDKTDCTSILSGSTAAQRSGSFTVSGLPAEEPGTYYYAYVRIWNSSSPYSSLKLVPLDGMIDLRTATTQSINGTIPGA